MLQADVSVLQWRRGMLSSECADGWEWRGGLGGCEQDQRRWCQSNAILVADDFDQVQCKPSVVHECFRCFLILPTPAAVPCPFSNGFLGNPIPATPDFIPACVFFCTPGSPDSSISLTSPNSLCSHHPPLVRSPLGAPALSSELSYVHQLSLSSPLSLRWLLCLPHPHPTCSGLKTRPQIL